LVATLAAGAFSAALVSVGSWDKTKGGLLTALSVLAAASLVRLARGIPFSNADHFEPQEVELVTAALRQLARSLRAFLGVVLGTMVLLVAAQPLSHLIDRLWLVDTAKAYLDRAISFFVGAALAYVLSRMWQIVGSDLSLLDKQADFIVRAVHRKARAKEEKEADELGTVPFNTPEGYGRRLQ
jgi:hypothetical protein